MKKFDNFKDAMFYAKHIMEEANKTYIGAVTEQLYKDSNEFTYRDTGDMYKSGELFSQFNKGIIIERTPYVRKRYYEGGEPGKSSPAKAGPHWFERCFSDNKKKYEGQYVKSVNQAKKG